MKNSVALLLGTAIAAAAWPTTIYTQDREADASLAVAYKPPLRGAPLTRVGGGARGIANVLALNVLAPSDTGYTTEEKPTIYWFASQGIDKPVELTIINNATLQSAAKPVFETTLQPPIAKGIHAFRLADHGVALEPGVEYQWTVAVVRNPTQRSNDVLAGGTIKRVTDNELQVKLARIPRAQWPAFYAAAGIWYDAIDELSRQISADQANRQLRERRAALLEQVGLREAAAFDREPGS